ENSEEAHQWQWMFCAVWHVISVVCVDEHNEVALHAEPSVREAVAILVVLVEVRLVDAVGATETVAYALIAVRWRIWVAGHQPPDKPQLAAFWTELCMSGLRHDFAMRFKPEDLKDHHLPQEFAANCLHERLNALALTSETYPSPSSEEMLEVLGPMLSD